MTINLDLLDEESATEAIEITNKLAEENGIDWALVGGLAMALYGGDVNTKVIEIIATGLLPMENQGLLKQGGKRYAIKTNKKTVVVDWIIRKDEFKVLFEQALQESVKISGVPVLTPEWLVILKFIAGRFKDQEDAVFLLSKIDLVDRKLIRQKLIDLFGKPSWGLAKLGLQRWFDIADNKSREDKRNEAAGYIDS